ncbi:MAG: S49 family peptidase [Coxiellaceae bacterium]|nr:S49 family peptidase [Coxiellaceae bacterium]
MEDEKLQKVIVDELLVDRRKDRRWRNFRFFLVLLVIIIYASLILLAPNKKSSASEKFDPSKPYVSLIRLSGEIMPDKPFSANKVLPLLQRAFSDPRSKGVVLVINSPGGSPVQASIIHDKIIQLKQRYLQHVIVLGVDSLASGAYLVASAADKIYVNPDTITGSIGVVMSGFGFTDAIKKLGVTRRVFTAGNNKVRMDPFEPVSQASKEKIDHVLEAVHKHFIKDVTEGRKGRLHGDPKQLFSGDFWIGSEAVKLGLADGTGQLWTIMKNNFKVTQYRDYSHRPSFLRDIISDVRSEVAFSLVDNHMTPVKAEHA